MDNISQEEKDILLKRLRRPNMEHLARARVFKTVNDKCKRQKICFKCGALNLTVKYV